MFKMENRQIDSKPTPKTVVKQGKKGIFRVVQDPSETTPEKDILLLRASSRGKSATNTTDKSTNGTNVSPGKSTTEREAGGDKRKDHVENDKKSPKRKENDKKSPKRKGNDKKSPKRKENDKKSPKHNDKKSPKHKENDKKSPKHKKNMNSSPDEDSESVISMDDNTPLVLMTWIGRKVNVRNVKKSLEELINAMEALLPPGTFYSCCEHFDTYLTGGLYPALHMTSDRGVIKKVLNTHHFISSTALGENNMIEQAVYSEVASVIPPGDKKAESSVIAVAGFRSIEETTPEILIREWKSWTGTRGFIVDILQVGLNCINVKFYVKKEPKDEPSSFFYIVTTEVGINEPNDEGLFVDVLQRFRVERFLGFRTIYKVYRSRT